ncbi:hypothetical protein A3A79_02260 [Candidatus Gottesmanbacteria bacterium RIFCSPLOWO2_01_FULL_43_11b]|uniref:HTH crp-type domain-containing protein n=1 Tax=Candidatus Gottesmanbacteria bacterium RIFCSPLOWO2_01_FULL_43_11b TaxID=1798392 RepID=A0A1F6AI88_9BACT|nr:MAG: hypothetical protein A3A79_02260 [Candidatus Gottesmanbacteria bacterium RIFCSPLOWO2_01_FULL_43_11b]
MVQNDVVLRKTERFFAPYTTLNYKKGETIIRAEDPPPGVYFLKKGSVRQYLVSPSGDTLMVHVFKPGSFFPLMWALNDIPNTFYFEALVDVEAHRAPKDKVVAFLKENADVLFYTLQRLLSGLHGIVTRIGHVILDDAYTKTALLLLYYSKNFGERANGGIVLHVPLVHREIAAWIGTTRETASLQMEALKKKGIIETRGRQLIITDVELLEKEIDRSPGVH